MIRVIFSRAASTSSGRPEILIRDPRDKIFKSGNFFFKMSNLLLLIPKNSIGLTVSRLMICSVNAVFFTIVSKKSKSEYEFFEAVHSLGTTCCKRINADGKLPCD